MNKIISTLIGDIEQKRAYQENEKRAKSLPVSYAFAYKEIKTYIFATSGLLSMKPLESLVDLFEEAAANGQYVLDVTGQDVAAFVDELVRGEKSYYEKQRTTLNESLAKKLR